MLKNSVIGVSFWLRVSLLPSFFFLTSTKWPDLGNGLLLTVLKNIRPESPETKLSYLVATQSRAL